MNGKFYECDWCAHNERSYNVSNPKSRKSFQRFLEEVDGWKFICSADGVAHDFCGDKCYTEWKTKQNKNKNVK